MYILTWCVISIYRPHGKNFTVDKCTLGEFDKWNFDDFCWMTTMQ